MTFDNYTICKKYLRGDVEFELHFDFDLKDITGHNRKTFDYCQSLIYFLQNNTGKQIYLTKTLVEDFQTDGNKLVINLPTYQEFCKTISSNGKNKTQAFLSQKVKSYSEQEKQQIIDSSTEEEILSRIKTFTPEQKGNFLEKAKEIEGLQALNSNIGDISDADFLNSFLRLLNDPAKKALVISNYADIQIKVLEEHKTFLESNLQKSETFIQDWIDGKIDNNGEANNLSEDEVRKVKKSRCLIFGLEFIDHKREGEISSKRFDILTRISQGKNDYVLIELKSPNSDVFKVKINSNQNEGESAEYSLSDDIARAIPQISDYRDLLENNASDIEWQRIGLSKGKISKSLIIIGTKKDDSVWVRHFSNLKRNLSSSIEILTYSDLILKLETTLNNLKNNL